MTVHVVVTCANRKSRPASPYLQLGNVPGETTAERARIWLSRLTQTNHAESLPAADLYAGEHWSVAKGLPTLGQAGETVRLWACSAGYGLIPTEAPIMPYHATLTPAQADSVPSPATNWWAALSEWSGPMPGQPRTIRDLVTSDPAAVFMLVLSAAYLQACRDDISSAVSRIDDQRRLFVVSAGARPRGELAALVLPADARLQAHVGGTRRALNARIAKNLLAAGVRRRDEASAHLTKLLAAQPPIPRYDRRKLSDREITVMITECLTRTPTTSANRLLREFRDSGLACEQHRFSRLYRTVAEVRS